MRDGSSVLHGAVMNWRPSTFTFTPAADFSVINQPNLHVFELEYFIQMHTFHL